MADKKTQLMAQFYEQCQQKGYTDMHDETQSLKAKVIAVDLNLKYGDDIVSFFEKAEQCHKQIEAEKEETRRQQEIARRKEQEEAKKRAVNGELLAEIFEPGKDSERNVIRVYIRPDKSIYSMLNNYDIKIEGAPVFSAENGKLMLYKYHPSQAIYTGATVGGITTGGVHYTKDGYSVNSLGTENADICVALGNTNFIVDKVNVSEYTTKKFYRDQDFKKRAGFGVISCRNGFVGDTSYLGAALSYGDYATKMYAISKAADQLRLPASTCCEIVQLLGRIVNGRFPPSDEEIYAQADRLAKSNTAEQLKRAAEMFQHISDFRDSSSRAHELNKKYEEALQTEKEQKILKEEARKEEKKKKRKKAKRVCVIIVVLLVVVAIASFALTTVVIPSQKYATAVELMDAGKYDEATVAFDALGDYKDSAEQALEARYSDACRLAEEGDYDSAIELFGIINHYKDSKARRVQAKYDKAVVSMEAGDYETAALLFEEISKSAGDTRHYTEKEKEARYLWAKECVAVNQLREAHEILIKFSSDEKCSELLNQFSLKLLKTAEKGDEVIFGRNIETGAPIEWVVARFERTYGRNYVCLLSRYAVAEMPYHTSNVEVAWEQCSLRKWLNGEFYNNAFSSKEKALIILPYEYSSHDYVELPNYTDEWLLKKMGANQPQSWWDMSDYVALRDDGTYRHSLETVDARACFELITSAQAVRPIIWIDLDKIN